MAETKPLTFSDIMTANVVHYDPAHHDTCVAFCRERKIEILPAVDDDYFYYQLYPDGNFIRKELFDPARVGELIQEFSYRLNGELIRTLRNLTAELIGKDTYSYIGEPILDVGKKFRENLKEEFKKQALVNARRVNDLIGIFNRKYAEQMFEGMRARLPEVEEEAWKKMKDDYYQQINGAVIQKLSPAMTYLTRRKWIHPLLVAAPDEYIFKDDIYERFRFSSILFVMNNGALDGIVHFSDYNRLPVVTQTFEKLHGLEREMVKALSHRKIQLKDVMAINEEANFSEREIRNLTYRTENDPEATLKYQDMAKLYLKTLLKIYNEAKPEGSVPFSPIRHTNIINLLRNRIAHSSDLIDRVDSSRTSLIFDFKSFSAFYRQHRALETALKLVTSHNFFVEITE